MKSLDTMKTLMAAGALAVSAGAVSASTLTPIAGSSCSTDPTSFVIGSEPAFSMPCEGIFDGNPSNTINANTEAFGITGWMEIVKVDDAAPSPATKNGITLTVNVLGDTHGTWSVSEWPSFPYIMVALKGGPTFSLFKIDPSKGLSGTWDTASLQTGGGDLEPGLSNVTVWAAIPLPAAGWLLLAGLGALGAAARRQRRKAA